MKVVLSIAGSDCSGGAGLQADLKTFEAFDVFGCTVITVLTAGNTTGVKNISEITPSFVKEQLEMIVEDFDISAIKIGMLYSNEIINVIREFIKGLQIPIVLDPVCISKTGSMLLSKNAMENLKTLFNYTTVITPNQFEAKVLLNYQINCAKARKEIENLKCSTLIKNYIEKEKSVDILYSQKKIKKYKTLHIQSRNTHGTGCSFSSAIAANLALGKSLEEAIIISNKFIYKAIKSAPNLGQGIGPISHKKGVTTS